MAIQPMALGIQPADFNAMESFSAGMTGAANAATAKTNIKTAEIEQARAGLEMIGSLALGSMNGDINGTPDPARFEEGLEYLASQGIDVTPFRGRADLAPLVARSSMTALQQIQTAQNQQQIDLAMDKFEFELDQARKAPPPVAEAPQIETFYDPETGQEYKAQWTPDPSAPEGGFWQQVGGNKAGSAEGQFSTLTSEEARALGLDPSKVYQRGADGKISEVGGSLVSLDISNNSQVESEYDKTLGKGYGEQFLEIRNQAQQAQSAINSLEVMEQAMAQPGFYSGAGAEQVAQLKRWGQVLGLDAEGIDGIEAFNAQAKSAALDAMGGSLGTGFSNADRDFVLDQVPQLANSPEGNAALIRIQKAINGRKIEIAQRAREYAAQNDGRIDAGFDEALSQWAQENPLFPEGSIFGTGDNGADDTGSAPEGVPADVWAVMTPEERALWQ